MKHFPIYVVRNPNQQGCGHQHQTQEQAHNCAVNTLAHHKTMPHADVLRIRPHATAKDILKQNVVETIEQTPAA